MTDIVERDALASTPDVPDTPAPHAHEEAKSFVATPRTDDGLLARFRTWWKSELTPGVHVVRKDAHSPRHMFIITSNSYEDREKETITSAALKAYEDSCFPGEDVYHNDNPLLWWHDDDVVMGDIVAVNYSEPFLVEVAEEAPTLMAKVLWDYAEQNEDNAGASHRYGYYTHDRQADGTYTRIFKKESTYLPERGLAANLGTYAGVMKMASAQSDARLDQIFEQIAGIKNASQKIHAKSGELEKELEAAGIRHKALATDEKAAAVIADTPAGVDVVAEGAVEADAKAEAPMPVYAEAFNRIMALVMDLVDSQAGLMAGQDAIVNSVKALSEQRTAEKAAEATKAETVSAQLAAMAARLEIAEKRLSLVPKSVTTQEGSTPEAVKAAVDQAQKAREDDDFEEVPGWGKIKKLS
jgi:hypothetical protein